MMLCRVKEFRLPLGDTHVDCITFGKGSRPLIMIQGLNTRGIRGAGASLALMYRSFARSYRVYLFDRRADLPENVTVRQMAADVAAAMDALHLEQADVIGVSQGGMIAQYLAIDHPQRVRKLVLALTLARNNATVEEVIQRWIDMTEQGQMKSLVMDMAVRMYSPAYLKRYRPFLPLLTLLQKPKDTPRFITLARSCLTCGAYEELERIACPTLVIGARQDMVVGGGASVELAEKLGCELHMYEHLGHAAYEEAKDFNQRILDFLHTGMNC